MYTKSPCRICLDETYFNENPLVTPCNCIGSLKYIHLECVKTWLDSKKVSTIGLSVHSYFWDNLQCEICKAFFVLEMLIEGKKVSLLNFDLPDSGMYMILESDMPSSQIKKKAIHVLDLSKKEIFFIGRDTSISDIIIGDLSVSRNQSTLIVDIGKKIVSL